MDFELSEEQKAVVDATVSLLEQRAGAKRAIELQRDAGYDEPLHAALDEAGFMDIARDEDMGPLEAVLVCEQVARAGGVASYAANALVLPAVGAEAVAGAVALCCTERPVPLRFGNHCSHVLVAAAEQARLVAVEAGDMAAADSNFMYPMGRAARSLEGRGESLGPGSGARARNHWRLALSAELVGTMDAALDCTVEYVSNRRQFGVPIGSFQAVKHRLAGCKVLVEGARWLTYEAAHRGAPAEAVATAASYAATAARQVHGETHQLTGALGFTREHDLHVWSMRLQALRLELGGATGHRRALASERWGFAPTAGG